MAFSPLLTAVRQLGPRDALLCAVGQALANTAFCVAASMTTTANCLVILASAPLVTALLGRLVLSTQLPAHTWLATASGFVGVLIVFSGSLGGSGRELWGCGLAVLIPLGLAIFYLVAAARPDANAMPALPLACALNFTIALAFLSYSLQLELALPASKGVLLMALLNGGLTNLGYQAASLGCQFISAPEAALIMLLETVVSPGLVYAVAGERPSPQTVAAGCLIVVVLALHALYDMRLERQKRVSEEEATELLALDQEKSGA